MKVIKKEDYIEDLVVQIPLQQAIKNNTIDAIPLDKVKQAREEMWKKVYEYSGTGDEVLQSYCDGFKASLQIIDKLIEEVEEDAKAGDHERTV